MKLKITLLIVFILSSIKADDCNCGKKSTSRIYNGEFAARNSFPWMVSLATTKGSHFCGGAILNEKYIITAFHCFNMKTDLFLIDVRVGIHNLYEKGIEEKTYKVKKIYALYYDSEKNTIESRSDIAILELAKNITFIEGVVEKGCFNLEERNYPGQLLAAGWGLTEKDNRVLKGDLKQMYYIQKKICRNYTICVEPETKGDSVCYGDSGGPLHYTENGVTKIEGVSSYVHIKKLLNSKENYCIGHAGYSRLSYFADWISKTAEYNFCGARKMF